MSKKNKPAKLVNNNLIGTAETGSDAQGNPYTAGPEEVYNVEATEAVIDKKLGEAIAGIDTGAGGGGGGEQNSVVYLGKITDPEPNNSVLNSNGATLADTLFGDNTLKTGYTIRDGQDRDWRYVADEDSSGGGGGSGNGQNEWTANTGHTVSFNRVIYTGSLFVAIGNGGHISTSEDGKVWTSRTSGTSANLLDIIYIAGSGYIAVGSNSTVVTSSNAISWTAYTVVASNTPGTFTSVATDGTNIRIGAYENGNVVHATSIASAIANNANSWAVVTTVLGGTANQARYIAYGNAQWVAALRRGQSGAALLYTMPAGSPPTVGAGITEWPMASGSGSPSRIRYINGSFWVITAEGVYNGNVTSTGGKVYLLGNTPPSTDYTSNAITPSPQIAGVDLWDIAPYGTSGVIIFANNGTAWYTTNSAATPIVWQQLDVGSANITTPLRSGALAGNDTANGTLVVAGDQVRYTRYYAPAGQGGNGGSGGGAWYLVGGSGQGGSTPNNPAITITQNGVTAGSFTLDQDNPATINIAAPNWEAANGMQGYISNKPSIPADHSGQNLNISVGSTGVLSFNVNDSATKNLQFIAGTNVTLTPGGNNNDKTITINSTASGGGSSGVSSFTSTAPLTPQSGVTGPVTVGLPGSSSTNVVLRTGATASSTPTWGKVALGTDVSGTLPVANGGTNLSLYTQNSLLYASGTTTIAGIAPSSNANRALVTATNNGTPTWGYVPISALGTSTTAALTGTASASTFLNGAGAWATPSATPTFSGLTQGGAMYASSTSGILSTASGNTGDLLVSSGTAAPVWGKISGYYTSSLNATASTITAPNLRVVSGTIIGILFSGAYSGTANKTLAANNSSDTGTKYMWAGNVQLNDNNIINYVSTDQISLWQYNGSRWNLLNPIAQSSITATQILYHNVTDSLDTFRCIPETRLYTNNPTRQAAYRIGLANATLSGSSSPGRMNCGVYIQAYGGSDTRYSDITLNPMGGGMVIGSSNAGVYTKLYGGLVVYDGNVSVYGNFSAYSTASISGRLDVCDRTIGIDRGIRLDGDDALHLHGSTSDAQSMLLDRMEILFFAATNTAYDSSAAGFRITYDKASACLRVQKKTASGSWTNAAWNNTGALAGAFS